MGGYGCTYGRADGRSDVQTDVWKFTPVSYRILALWGRCPKSRRKIRSAKAPIESFDDERGVLALSGTCQKVMKLGKYYYISL